MAALAEDEGLLVAVDAGDPETHLSVETLCSAENGDRISKPSFEEGTYQSQK